MGVVRPANPIEILQVEDSRTDVLLTSEALTDCTFLYRLCSVDNGEKALAYLRHSGEYTDAIRPDLILLDLNLPRIDGIEVLAEIKTDDELKTIPVVVFTTSRGEKDILRSYRLHANCYIPKPIDLDMFRTAVRAIESFWLGIALLPPKETTHG